MTCNNADLDVLKKRFGFYDDESRRFAIWLEEINEDSNIVLNRQKVHQFRSWNSEYIRKYYITCCYDENMDMHIEMLKKIGYYDCDYKNI